MFDYDEDYERYIKELENEKKQRIKEEEEWEERNRLLYLEKLQNDKKLRIKEEELEKRNRLLILKKLQNDKKPEYEKYKKINYFIISLWALLTFISYLII